MVDMNRIVTKRSNGEYSTAIVSGGQVIETMWFGDDGSSITVGRDVISKSDISKRHIREFEERSNVKQSS